MLISPSASASCDAQRTLQPFLNILPQAIDVKQKLRPEDFTRTRKLPLPKIIVCTLSLVGNGNDNGVDIHMGDFSVMPAGAVCGLAPKLFIEAP